MSENDRLLQEAQLIAAEFSFWMVKGQLSHLYGNIYESKDGLTKHPLEIVYDDTFPTNPPEISFPQDIPNLPEEIQLESLNNWTTESHVVEIVRELYQIVKNAVEGNEIPKMQSIPKSAEPVIKDRSEATQSMQSSKPSIPTQPIQSAQPTQPVTSKPNTSQEEYLTPDSNAYPTEQYVVEDNSANYPVWGEEDTNAITGDSKLAAHNSTAATPATIQTTPIEPQYSTPEIVDTASDSDLTLSTEAALIQQEYAMDYVGDSLGSVEIYLTITIEQTFIIKIDFSDYPKRPKVLLQEGITNLIGDVNESLDILKKWKEKKPSNVVEIIRELESKLWFLSDLDTEAKQIIGEYKTEMVGGMISNLKVSLFTYGFKEFTLSIDISKYPAQPKLSFSKELSDLIKVPIENLNAYSKWKRKESHAVDLLREVSWLVDKNSRINFEMALLKGGLKNVSFDATSNIISAKLAGSLKTKDLSFEFEVKLTESYPMSAPEITLKSELEAQPDIKEKLTKQIGGFVDKWSPFSYLIDLFNAVSKANFAVSVISCVICHKIDCPTCNMIIAAPDPAEQCQVMCPHCERLYHKHCWDQTIISFGKCGFCLRPPPENLRPQM